MLKKPININYYVYVLIALILFLITTNVFNLNDSIIIGYQDVENYILIAKNGFNIKNSNLIPLYHLERWPIHYIIGRIAKNLNIENVYSIYKILNLICIIILSIIVNLFKTNKLNKIAIFIFILFNPYLIRMYMSVPGNIVDHIFIILTITLIYGLLEKNWHAIYLSLLIAPLSRQTSIILILIFIIYSLKNKFEIKKSLIVVILYFITYFIIKDITKIKFNVNSNSGYLDILFNGWNIYDKNFNVLYIFRFISRYFIFYLSILYLFSLKIIKLNRDSYLFLFFFILIQIQPLIGGPLVTGNNIQRLSAFSIPFLIPFIITIENKILLYYIIICSIILSFHHNFSILYNYKKIEGSSIFILLLLLINVITILIPKKFFILNVKN